MLRREVSQMKSRGFTLTELLVVIAIIAILAAILFPVFAKVREKARQTTCLSNEKQIGLGLLQYVQDYDENYGIGAQNDRGAGWAGEVLPYIKEGKIFTCPSDPTVAGGQNSAISYAFSQSTIWAAPGCNAPTTLSEFTAPAVTVMLLEVANVAWFPRNDAPGSPYSWVASPTANGMQGPNLWAPHAADSGTPGYATGAFPTQDPAQYPIAPRHTGGSNFLLADGHAKWMKPASISPGLAAPNSSSPASQFGGCYNAVGVDAMGIGGDKSIATFSPR